MVSDLNAARRAWLKELYEDADYLAEDFFPGVRREPMAYRITVLALMKMLAEWERSRDRALR